MLDFKLYKGLALRTTKRTQSVPQKNSCKLIHQNSSYIIEIISLPSKRKSYKRTIELRLVIQYSFWNGRIMYQLLYQQIQNYQFLLQIKKEKKNNLIMQARTQSTSKNLLQLRLDPLQCQNMHTTKLSKTVKSSNNSLHVPLCSNQCCLTLQCF